MVRIDLPPLRERPEDIPILAAHFAAQLTGRGKPKSISQEAQQALVGFNWHGNISHLYSVIERACVLAGGGSIQLEHLPPDIRGV